MQTYGWVCTGGVVAAASADRGSTPGQSSGAATSWMFPVCWQGRRATILGMAGTRRRWDQEKDGALASQVADVCVNGIYEFRHERRADQVSGLREIAECRYGRIRKAGDFEGLLDRLFSDAIEGLEEPERQAASHSFGLRRSDSYKNDDLKIRQKNAAEAYSKATRKQISQFTYAQKPEYERTIIVNVGRAIEDLYAETTEQGQKARTESRSLGTYKPYTTPYVRRPHYHEEFEAALNNGYKIIAFVGPPGVGKDRLVDQILAEKMRECDSLRYLECGSPKNFLNDIVPALEDHEIQDQRLTDEQLLRNFIFLIHSQKSPTYVVLHYLHLHDSRFLHHINPSKLGATIVIVGNYPFAEVPYVHHIKVEPPHPKEAIEMARYLLPNAVDSELSQLIDTLGCSPQALESAAGFLPREDSKLTVATFCRTFTRDAALILRSVDGDLLGRFKDAFEALQGSRPTAAEVLEYLVFLADFVPMELLVAAIADKNDSAPEEIEVIHQIALDALDALHAGSLIRVDDGYVKLYKLVQMIGRYLIGSEKSDEIADRLRSVIRELITRVSREQGQEAMDTVRLLVNHLFHVENNKAGRRDHKGAGREVAKAIQGLWGESGFDPLVEIVPVVERDRLVILKLTFRLDLTRYGESVRADLERIARETGLPLSPED